MLEKLTSIALPSQHLRLKHCRHGVMLFNSRDQYVGASLDRYGEFSELEAQLFSGLIKRGMLVVEVGANIGAHTVHLAKLVGEDGGVVAFEPQRVIYQMLCANLALNGLENTDAKCLAVGAAAGEVVVPRVDNGIGALSLGGDDGDVVEMIAMDNLMLPACHMIKIDVEGMEKQVLDGARQTITRFRPYLYVKNDRIDKHAELIATLLDLDYRMWWHQPWLYNPGNLAGDSENVFPGIAAFNLICLPREAAPDELEGGVEVKTAADPHPLLALGSVRL
ncbi:MAG: FkbM family methyltransferase [Roseomonas sp.]|jgi:FkbM family methyltransferase|nr:FkbM family methyltransferase [Roseomonas sp.]MCA3305567.1 FkbM family methyltransferase [Roseomonas sp.]